MSLIVRMRRQTAVYWKRGSVDKYGKYSFDAPVQIKCRWHDKRGQFRNERGELFNSVATVYVDRVMYLGDKLKRGELDSDTDLNPKTEPEAFEIQVFEQIPNLRATETLLIAHL